MAENHFIVFRIHDCPFIACGILSAQTLQFDYYFYFNFNKSAVKILKVFQISSDDAPSHHNQRIRSREKEINRRKR